MNTPVISRATIICATEKAQVCKTAPIDMITTPIMRVFFLPVLSPNTCTSIIEAESYAYALMQFTEYESGHGTKETEGFKHEKWRNTE